MLLGGLAVGCLIVLYPFFSALLWAAILAFTTWPIFEWLQVRLRLRRGPAALVMVLLTAVVLVLPLALVAPESAADVSHLRHGIETALRDGLPLSPPWLHDVPLVGPELSGLWDSWAADISAAFPVLRPYFGIVLEWLYRLLIGLAGGVLMFVLALFIAFFFYVYGEPLADRLRAILLRIAGPQGDRMLTMTGLTVR
ncbi:MAG TPA: AI-2E family transporter, partial [Acetobacteraceae bacterium]|nr:AI-2E family transporter [Acetobacteraceae bacterium]